MQKLYTTIAIARSNLASDYIRVIYVICTLSVTTVAWLGLAALASPFMQPSIPSQGISVQNVRQGDNLPLRYANQIEKLSGVLNVSWMNFLPLVCKPPATATLNAWGGQGAYRELADIGISKAQEVAFNADPLGILVGFKLAQQCGWRAGMTAQPPNMFGQPIELHVIGVYHSTKSWGNQIAYAHYAYINRLLPSSQRDRVQFISVSSNNLVDAPTLAARINTLFAHADPPVDAHTDKQTQNALARFGNVQLLLALVMVAVLLCSALVLVSVWAHAAAQRRAHMAILQALGFSRTILFAAFALEEVALGVLGVALGVVVGLTLIHVLAPSVMLILGAFAAPAFAYALLPAWFIPLLIVAMIAPALLIARTRAADYQAV